MDADKEGKYIPMARDWPRGKGLIKTWNGLRAKKERKISQMVRKESARLTMGYPSPHEIPKSQFSKHLHKLWFCSLWRLLTYITPVYFWKLFLHANSEPCSSHTAPFQNIFWFLLWFFTFHGGFNPPWIRLGSSPASWGRLPLIKTRSGCLYEYPRGSLPHEHIGLHRFHGVDFHGGTLPMKSHQVQRR